MREITLSNGLIALVDEADFASVRDLRWHATGRAPHVRAKCRVERGGKTTWVSLSRFLMGAEEGVIVDHINGDTLDNRRANLRLCTHAENLRNRRRRAGAFKSPFKGVTRNRDRWVAQVGFLGKRHYAGTWPTAEEAAKAYDRLAAVLHGEFACLNFPEAA